MSMGDTVPLSPAAACARLLELARRQGEALRAGDVDTCAVLMAEREALLRHLAVDPAAFPATVRDEVARLIREIRAVDRDNLLLLQVLRGEAADALDRLVRGRRGATAYLQARSPSEEGSRGCSGQA